MRMFLLGLVVGALLGVAGGVVVFDPETRPFAEGGSPAEPNERGEAPNEIRGDDGSRDGEPAAAVPAEAVPPTEQPPSGVAEDDLIGYLRVHLVGRPGRSIGGLEKKALAALRDRRAEVVPILEDWIRRQEEIRKAGCSLGAVFVAYAEVAGADAVPLLSEKLFEPPPSHWGDALTALERIDDPTAADVFRRYQESLPPGVSPLGVYNFFRRTEAGKALVRDWAESPPPGRPGLQEQCRNVLFRYGTEAERENVWRTASLPQRLGHMSLRVLTSPYPERYRETVLAALENEKLRNRAYVHVSANPGFYGEPVCDRTLAAIETEMNALGTGEKADARRRALRKYAWDVKAARRAREHEEKLREVLTPR